QPLPAAHAARVGAALRAASGLEAFVEVEAVVDGLQRAAASGDAGDRVALAPAVAVGLWLRDLQSGAEPDEEEDEEEALRVA
ncbi:MAG: hypothetical protein R3263_10445, partial [Myxococcota bacterium]|nr:hypothetical protein [Myxococcota bacterium]